MIASASGALIVPNESGTARPSLSGDQLQEASTSRFITRYANKRFESVFETMAVEAPLTVSFEGRTVASTMRTPGADEDLAIGMLFDRGLLCASEVDSLIASSHGPELVSLQRRKPPIPFGPRESHRGSSFGRPESPLESRGSLEPLPFEELVSKLFVMRDILNNYQQFFRQTGATHCAMFFNAEGFPTAFGEDVGRHNAFDKALGSALRAGCFAESVFGVVSSRLSHEIVSKALHTRILVLAGFSVATSIAVDLAREYGLALVGRLRDDRMNIYT